jgi:hypothetical protein
MGLPDMTRQMNQGVYPQQQFGGGGFNTNTSMQIPFGGNQQGGFPMQNQNPYGMNQQPQNNQIPQNQFSQQNQYPGNSQFNQFNQNQNQNKQNQGFPF